MHAGFWVLEMKEGGCFADKGVNGRIILKRMLKEVNGESKMDSSAERCEKVAACCENEDENWCYTNCEEILDYRMYSQFSKMYPTPRRQLGYYRGFPL